MASTDDDVPANPGLDAIQLTEGAKQAACIWNGSQVAGDRHPFLVLWGMKAAHGLRVYWGELAIDGVRCNGMMLMPMFDEARHLQNVAFTSVLGERRYLPGGRVNGLYYGWGSDRRTIVISEGFPRAARIHEATGHAVAVAFTAANVPNVVAIMRGRYAHAQIVLAADFQRDAQPSDYVSKPDSEGMIAGGAVSPSLDPSQTSTTRAQALGRQEATHDVQPEVIAALRPLQVPEHDPVDPVPPTHLQDAEKLIDWVRRKKLTAFTRKQVMQLGPNSLRPATTAKAVLLTLVQQGQLTTEDNSLYRVPSANF
jgi:hypothetical protein